MEQDRLKLLKSLHLLDQVPEKKLAALGEFLKPISLQEGQVLFEEGSRGSSLFFVSSGHVQISKRVANGAFKDLAILGPGDCFGEMALIEDVARSARASASGAAVVLELAREDLNRWLKSHPELAIGFFAELVQVQSKRLRRTSNELTLLFDLSQLLLEPVPSGKELMGRVLEHVVPHLEGSWSAAASLYNPFNEELELAAATGGYDFQGLSQKLPPATETRNLWCDSSTYYVSLPGAKRPCGHLVFHSQAPLSEEDKNETGRTLTTVARLLTSALENINFRTEDALRERLKAVQAHTSRP